MSLSLSIAFGIVLGFLLLMLILWLISLILWSFFGHCAVGWFRSGLRMAREEWYLENQNY